MKLDRYTKLILTVIATSLAWLALSQRSEPTAFAQAGRYGRYAIAAGSGGVSPGVYRLDTATGDLQFCYLNSQGRTTVFTCDP